MKDIVIIPTFDRPEFLWACLDNLDLNVRGSHDKMILITEDIHADKPKGFTTEWEMLATINEFRKRFGSNYLYRATPPHTTYGNSYNLLSAIAEAPVRGADKVYLIEDDVLVTPDFFEWNDEVHRSIKPWASCAGRLNRSLNFHMNGPEAIDESIKDPNACHTSVSAYNSWATCFSSKAVEDITKMADSFEKFRAGFEQDIEIQNHIRRQKLTTVWPYVPRAYHMGWYSYHRNGGMKLYGELGERVQALHHAVLRQDKLRALAGPQDIDAFPTKHCDQFTRLYVR